MTEPPRNLPASVQQRLLNRSRRDGVDFQYLLVRYASERLLYRLSQSTVRERFVLKGATVFLVWGPEVARQSRDVDLLSLGPMAVEHVRDTFRMLCDLEVTDDGLRFDPESIRAEEIREQTEYGGVRIRLIAYLGTAVAPVQVDVGFGDAIVPEPVEANLPTLLDFPAPRLRTYPQETVIAEKLEAMVRLGAGNTRLKDFYDVWSLSRAFEFDGAPLAEAVRATFQRRQTALPVETPTGLQPEFAAEREAQWRAFCRRIGVVDSPSFGDVVRAVREFLMPVCVGLSDGRLPVMWVPGQGWGPAPQ